MTRGRHDAVCPGKAGGGSDAAAAQAHRLFVGFRGRDGSAAGGSGGVDVRGSSGAAEAQNAHSAPAAPRRGRAPCDALRAASRVVVSGVTAVRRREKRVAPRMAVSKGVVAFALWRQRPRTQAKARTFCSPSPWLKPAPAPSCAAAEAAAECATLARERGARPSAAATSGRRPAARSTAAASGAAKHATAMRGRLERGGPQ